MELGDVESSNQPAGLARQPLPTTRLDPDTPARLRERAHESHPLLEFLIPRRKTSHLAWDVQDLDVPATSRCPGRPISQVN